jgi:hypothetical protein
MRIPITIRVMQAHLRASACGEELALIGAWVLAALSTAGVVLGIQMMRAGL